MAVVALIEMTSIDPLDAVAWLEKMVGFFRRGVEEVVSFFAAVFFCFFSIINIIYNNMGISPQELAGGFKMFHSPLFGGMIHFD